MDSRPVRSLAAWHASSAVSFKASQINWRQAATRLDLDTLVREGARMLVAALKEEVDEYIAEHADHATRPVTRWWLRNGDAEPRMVTTAAGELEIQAPRVHDRREGRRFTSIILLAATAQRSAPSSPHATAPTSATPAATRAARQLATARVEGA